MCYSSPCRYGHLLLTQDDSEFLGEDHRGSDGVGGAGVLRSHTTAAFTVGAVVEIVAVLRDLTVSLFTSDAL